MIKAISFNSKLFTKVLILFFFLITAQCQLPQISELYLGTTLNILDRINVWETNGNVQGPISGGYNFTLAWRRTLPTIISTSLGLYNFVNGPNGILSF